MKTTLKYLTIVVLAIAALMWFAIDVRSTEEEKEELGSGDENPAAREAFRRMQLQDENGQIPPNAWTQAYEQKAAMLFRPEAWGEFLQGIQPGVPGPTWISIGPGNIGGRIRSLVIHPEVPDTMWIGAVGGGVWKTTDGGKSWSTNTDVMMANLAVNCMAMDPANPNILYAGTGEGFYPADRIQGNGIYKTTDGGDHWTPLSSTVNNENFHWVNRLAICPANSQLLLAGTQFGLFRSEDGGDNWVRVMEQWGILDVRFRPNNGTAEPNAQGIKCIVGTRGDGAFHSSDGGMTWERATGLPEFPGRVELAYSRSNPSIVYASVENHGGQLFKSADGGHYFDWTGVGPIGIFNPSHGTGASWYNNALWVDPTNPDTVITGGEKLWRTTLVGGGTWANTTGIHVDNHVIVEHPGYNGVTNKVVYGVNDGGICKTDNVLADPVIWTSLNHNLGVTQFYGAAGHVASGKIIGGTQDNGTLRFRPQDGPENWITMYGGDGGFCAVDQTATPYFYGEYTNLRIYRSTNGAEFDSGQYIWDGIPHVECSGVPCADFIAPFVLDPNNENRILAGGKSLWRSNNVRATEPSQVSWVEIKSPVSLAGNISAMAVVPGNSNIIWVGYNNGSVYYTTNGTAASPSPTPTWIPADPSGMLPHRFCTRITIGQAPPAQVAVTDDPQVIATKYVTFGGFKGDNVWKTQDNGTTWTDISNNLPNVPIYSLVVSPFNPDALYIGTEVGVFAGVDDGANTTWSPSTGDPNVQVKELFWMGNKLVAATHGRGLFTLTIPSP